MAFHITPSLGIDLSYNSTNLPYIDTGKSSPSPGLGTKVNGNDGHVYVLVKAGAALAAAADIIINDTTFVATAGTGPYAAPVAVANGAYFWAKADAI